MKNRFKGKKCCKCGNTKESELSRHHIYPVRFFGNSKTNKRFVILCRSDFGNKCHQRLEKLISENENGQQQGKRFYTQCLKKFLKS